MEAVSYKRAPGHSIFSEIVSALPVGQEVFITYTRTDHSALQWLRKTPLPIGQQAHWLTVIEEFDFEVKHQAGSAHTNADALSSRPHLDDVIIRDVDNQQKTASLPEAWNRSNLAEEQ